MQIRPYDPRDFEGVLAVINDAAAAYRDAIPADRWHEPYMAHEELQAEIADGVGFLVTGQDGDVAGAMGIQDRGAVALIRHAYVATRLQRRGIGRALLVHLQSTVSKPLLVGTWAAAVWAVAFYERHGFERVSHEDKERLLREYWNIPDRQIETSVVLGDQTWRETGGMA